MNRLAFTAFASCSLLLVDSGVALAQATDTIGGIASTSVIVRFRADAFARSNIHRAGVPAESDALPQTSSRLQAVVSNWGTAKMSRAYQPAFGNPALAEKHGLDRTFVLEVSAGTDTKRLAHELSALNDEVEFAVIDVIGGVSQDSSSSENGATGRAAGAQYIPDDTHFVQQWAMHNIGQTVAGQPGTPDADIDAVEAWAIHQGDLGTVIVALIDSGLDGHPEYGTHAPPYPNGRILEGYNTVLDSSTPADLDDTCGNGTHVAGTVGATGNNAQGVAGVSWGVHLMPVKVLTGCTGTSGNCAEGIIWAADHGADVINMSLQFNLTSPALIAVMQSALDYAYDQGAVLIAATGTNNACGLGAVCYPGRANNVLAVSGTNNRDLFSSISNYGPETEISAPGEDVYSTWHSGGGYFSSDGTSSSSAHASGLAALIKSYAPQRTNGEIVDILVQSVDDLGPAGWDDHFGYGRINAAKALAAALCAVDDECNDGNQCTNDYCLDGFCENSHNSASCDDSQYCTIFDTCADGNCLGAPRDCSDGVACTVDECDEQANRCVNRKMDLCGSCCDSASGTCVDQTANVECLCDQCEWRGGASCGDFECERNTIPAVSTWGIMVLALLLLSAAKLRFSFWPTAEDIETS